MGFPRKSRSGQARRARQIKLGMTRRGFLRAGFGAGALGATVALSGCLSSDNTNATSSSGTVNPNEQGGTSAASVDFLHGIASGDPLQDRVILWTRVTPSKDLDKKFAGTVVVYADEALKREVARSPFQTSAARDFTVKVDQTGLQPDRFYFYQFECNGKKSPVGRTRTAPVFADQVNLGLVSCSSLAHGFFNAYRLLAEQEGRGTVLNAVVHLGDYIYEYASDAASGDDVYGTARPYEPTGEIKTLSDYRTRHAFYKKTDQDLQLLHTKYPFICIWDDHESADNSYKDGANNHQAGDGDWPTRKSWAEQAYDEWMPIRLPEAGNAARIWRKISYGNLADLILLDTRLWARTIQAGTPINPLTDNVNDPSRQLLGPEQKDWLKLNLKDSTAKWKLIGNQVVFHQWIIKPGTVTPLGLPEQFNPISNLIAPGALNGDSWDAYTVERAELMAFLRNEKIDNTVFLTGDVHSSWVADVTEDPNNPTTYNPLTGDGSIATEFVVTSVTSPGLPIPDQVVNGIRVSSPHIKYVNMSGKGYSILKLTPQSAQCEYWYVDTIAERGGGDTLAATYTVVDKANRISGA